MMLRKDKVINKLEKTKFHQTKKRFIILQTKRILSFSDKLLKLQKPTFFDNLCTEKKEFKVIKYLIETSVENPYACHYFFKYFYTLGTVWASRFLNFHFPTLTPQSHMFVNRIF